MCRLRCRTAPVDATGMDSVCTGITPETEITALGVRVHRLTGHLSVRHWNLSKSPVLLGGKARDPVSSNSCQSEKASDPQELLGQK